MLIQQNATGHNENENVDPKGCGTQHAIKDEKGNACTRCQERKSMEDNLKEKLSESKCLKKN